MGCLFDLLFQPLIDFFAPRTPWAWFVRFVVVGIAVVAYIVAEDAGALPWQ